jgi:hypothetical protein
MHDYLGWQIDIQFLGVNSYTFQVFSKTEHYICPQVFDSWDRTYTAAQEWISMQVARHTAIDVLDILCQDGRMSNQERDSLVKDLRHHQQ